METVVLVIHMMLALAIIALVLIQRSSGGGLGIGGSGGGLGDFASARSTANALTKATTFCAFLFFTTSITLGVLAKNAREDDSGRLFTEAPAMPADPAAANAFEKAAEDADKGAATDEATGDAPTDETGEAAPAQEAAPEGEKPVTESTPDIPDLPNPEE